MTEQLTSVRFSREALEALKRLAALNDGNVASEIRQAVDNYIKEVTQAPDFDERVEKWRRERDNETEESASLLLAARNQF